MKYLSFSLALSLLARAQDSSSNQSLTIPTGLRYPWQYQGCYTDSRENRTVSSSRSSISNTTTTIDGCLMLCANTTQLPPALSGHTFNYAALSYGTECFCGLTINPLAGKVADEQCNYTCSGNSTQPCGGSDHVSVYWNGEQPPVMNPGTKRWASEGCFNDTPSARLLPVTQSAGTNDMTVYICTSACYNQKYALAGLEYGRECYCGNQIQGAESRTIDASSCNMLCTGNSTEYCGGDGAVALYRLRDTSAAQSSVPSFSIASLTALALAFIIVYIEAI